LAVLGDGDIDFQNMVTGLNGRRRSAFGSVDANIAE
jgi:hypothetical protein